MTQEFRLEAIIHTEHILHHEYLTVNVRAGTDTDNGRAHLTGYACSQLSGNLLKHYGAATHLVKHVGIVEQTFGFGILLGTQSVATEFID